mgnify:CR=1 FL=1|tara:strand:+ start:1452 stop:1643 length:192 start_codon:yes stop_codon:yes gene_type:complete
MEDVFEAINKRAVELALMAYTHAIDKGANEMQAQAFAGNAQQHWLYALAQPRAAQFPNIPQSA